MLVQFKLKNFMSFKDETVLDMRAVNAYKEHESNLINLGKDKLLRVVSIYGANASGKSNLLKAFSFFRQLLMESANTVDKLEQSAIEKYYSPYAFSRSQDDFDKNTEFEIVIIEGEYEYRYGFEYNNKEIVTEWLYETPLNKRRVQSTIFERDRDQIFFGSKVEKESIVYKDQINHDTLLLSFFGKLKLQTKSYRNIFYEVFGIFFLSEIEDEDDSKNIIENLILEIEESKDDKIKFLKFLKAIDSGIQDVKVKKNDDEQKFVTIHIGKDKKEYELSLFSESEGTLRSMEMYSIFSLIILGQGVILVDELNSKLHPLLQKFIVNLFYEEGTQAQLIYTTHDPALMDKKFFRRDQIVFVEKNEFGESELAALSDYKIRSDASFSKDYLAGVYGGIPTLTEFRLKEGE